MERSSADVRCSTAAGECAYDLVVPSASSNLQSDGGPGGAYTHHWGWMDGRREGTRYRNNNHWPVVASTLLCLPRQMSISSPTAADG